MSILRNYLEYVCLAKCAKAAYNDERGKINAISKTILYSKFKRIIFICTSFLPQ